MEEYSGLAEIYDYLVAGVDYEGWADFVVAIFHRFNPEVKKVADIACGTGNTTLPLARRGFTLYGVDIAPAMLAKARAKTPADLPVVYLQQDMRAMRLPEKVDAVVCYHDGLNYMLSEEDLGRVFAAVAENLVRGGLFVFDLNSVERLAASAREEDVVFVDDEDLTLIYQTFYSREEQIWKISLTAFVRRGDVYYKIKEEHREKHFPESTVIHLLTKGGFSVEAVYGPFSFRPPEPDDRRIFVVARKK